MTTVEEDRTQARIDGLLQMLREAETDFRRSYARVLEVVAELEEQKAGAVSGFSTTARLLAGVLNLSKSEAKTRAEQAELLTPRRSLTGGVLPPTLPATAAELAAGAIRPSQLSPHATKDAPFQGATAHPATARHTTSSRGWTGARRNYQICA